METGKEIDLNQSSSAWTPLCVDLDGTLIQSDLLFESLARSLRRRPWILFLIPFWWWQGRSVLKNHLARHAGFKEATADRPFQVLPYNEEVLKYLKEQALLKRPIHLVSASDQELVDLVAEELNLFDSSVGSSLGLNLRGEAKRAYLVQRFGEKGYEYVGDSWVDVPVWKSSSGALIVSSNPEFVRRVSKFLESSQDQKIPIVRTFGRASTGLRHGIKALRVHQWAKNLLIFVPLVTSHNILNFEKIQQALLAFVAFSLVASGVYLTNDWVDLEADRRHHKKRFRPFAAGTLPLLWGMFLVPVLYLSGFALSLVLPLDFQLTLAVYFTATLFYSFVLKRILILDVVCLACLYTLRVIAGVTATGIEFSPWILAFSLFIFTSLGFVKRNSELLNLRTREKTRTEGRGYGVQDIGAISSLGPAAGYIAILVLALYIRSPEVALLYRTPHLLWGLCPLLLYWIGRMWLLANRGEIDEDPIFFAIRDRVSYIVGILAALVLWFAH